MEGDKGVAKNDGKDEVSVTVTPSDAEDDVHHKDKKNHNSSKAEDYVHHEKRMKNVKRNVIRCMFVCLVGILIASLTVPKLKDTLIWGLELWKWSILVLVILYGWLISNLLIIIPLVFTSVMNVPVVSLVLVYEMKKSVRRFIWLGLILLVWVLLINSGVERSKDTTKILDHVTNALAGCLVVAAIWFAKSLLIKLVDFSFQHGRFLDRIGKLSLKLDVVGTLLDKKRGIWNVRRRYWKMHKTGKEDSNEKHSRLRRERQKWLARIREVHFYEMIRCSISDILVDKEDGEQKDMETTRKSKVEAKAQADADKIFQKLVARRKHECICKEDLEDYLDKEDVDSLLRLFQTDKIEKSSLTDWMVKSYEEFEPHLHALNYTRKTLGELDRLASGIAIIIGIIVWCLMMGIFTTRMLLLISTQIVAASFMFGNTIKTVFEAIIFVFLMHPFDVGDQCVIDEEQMLVEEIRILCTVFLRNDMQKIFYPNSVLFTKPISNSFRNPETDDSVEFNIELSTSAKEIESLEKEIEKYVKGNPVYWLPNHSVVVKDIDNTGNLTMSLSVTHNINFQSSGEKKSRRSKLILKLREILEDLGIKYRLLPQEVHVKYI